MTYSEKIQRISSGIYFVTDSHLRPDLSLYDMTNIAIEGGATTLQLRVKDIPTQELVTIAKKMNSRCKQAGIIFIVNDRVDVALASEADGVHLGPDDMHPSDARHIMGPDAIIGVSVSTIDEAETIVEYASYLGVGAIFGSSTKSDAGDAVGTERITTIKSNFPMIPLVAIGGINRDNIHSVGAAGADSAAVISSVLLADDPVAMIKTLDSLWKQGRSSV